MRIDLNFNSINLQICFSAQFSLAFAVNGWWNVRKLICRNPLKWNWKFNCDVYHIVYTRISEMNSQSKCCNWIFSLDLLLSFTLPLHKTHEWKMNKMSILMKSREIHQKCRNKWKRNIKRKFHEISEWNIFILFFRDSIETLHFFRTRTLCSFCSFCSCCLFIFVINTFPHKKNAQVVVVMAH